MWEYIRSIRRLPRSVKWFLLTEMLYGLSTGVWNVNLNFHLKSNGFTNANIGSILAVASVTTAVMSLAAGSFCTRVGFRPSMVMGCVVKGLGMVLVGAAPSHGFTYLGQILFGVGDAFILSSEFPFLLGLVEEKYRHMVYNLLICSYLFAMFFGNLAGGTMYRWFPRLTTEYAFPVILCGALFIVMGMGRSRLPRREIEAQVRGVSFSVFKQKKIRWYLCYGMLGSASFYIFSSMTNIIYKDAFSLTDEEIGLIFSVGTALSCVMVFLVPLMISKWGDQKIVQVVLPLAVIFSAMMSFVGVQLYILFTVIRTFFGAMLPGAAENPMLQSVSAEQQGYYSGMKIFANSLGLGGGAMVSGFLLSYSSYAALMLVGASVSFLQYGVYRLGCRRYLD